MEIHAGLAFTISIAMLHLSTVSTTGNDLRLLDGCICPGHNITFQCTTVGGGITVWQGTAFDCPQSSNEITLRHAQFLGSVGVCNDGAICAHADSIQSSDCFVSNLTVLVTPTLEGRTVRCEYDNGATVLIVQSFTLNITRRPLPGPLNAILADASPSHLTFSWTPVSNSCRVQSYIINSTNCGACPRRTNLTTARCTGFEASSNCTFTVRTVVCENIVGTMQGTEISFTLQVPPPPRILNSTLSYLNNNTLHKIVSTFMATSSNLPITDTINSSTISYTTTYTASTSGLICGSHTIPAYECNSGVCIQEFDITTSSCFHSTDIIMKVFASNIFGNGPSSDPIIKDGINNFVRVEAQTNYIICTFLNPQSGEKSCSIVYGHDCQNLDSERLIGQVQEGDSVKIPLLQTSKVYCYHVTAISGGTSVNVTGSFYAEVKTNQQIVIVVLVVVVLLIMITIALLTNLYVCHRLSRYNRLAIIHKHPVQKPVQIEETAFLLDDQGPYTFIELCKNNTIYEPDDYPRDGDPYGQVPHEEYGITFMDLQNMKTDID